MMTICDVIDKRRLEHFHFRQTLRGGNLRLRFTTDSVVDYYDQRSFTCGKVNLSGEMPENVTREHLEFVDGKESNAPQLWF